MKAAQSEERKDQVKNIQQAIDAQLENGEIPSNLTYFLECIYPEKTSLLDYVSKDVYLIIDDYARFIEKSKSLEKRQAIGRRTISKRVRLLLDCRLFKMDEKY